MFHEEMLGKSLPILDQWQKEACWIDVPNILMLCGRQTGKSTFAAVMALHTVVVWPAKLVLLISPTLRQSTELFRKCMVLYDELPGMGKPLAKSKTEIVLANGSKIASLPGANPDAIRGFSKPDLIIEDESAFVSDQTFTAVRPMLATSERPRHILLTTPFGRRGHFYERWMAKDPRWYRFMIRSDECPRITEDFLQGEQRVLTDRAYRQEYECEFLEAATAVFPADVIERLVDNNTRRTELPDTIESSDPSGQQLIDGLVTAPGPWEDL